MKVVIVTGAAGGLGAAMVRSLARLDFQVFLLDIDQEKIDEAVASCRTKNVAGFICDVTEEKRVEEIFSKIYRCYNRIDVLINNAGLQYVSPVDSFPTAKFRYMLEVMLTAPFIATKHVLPYMKQNHFGRIINMASINGLVGFSGKAAYNSAKHGLIGLTKVTALETAAFGITVNAVCPGYVDTDLVRNQLSAIAASRGIDPEKVLAEIIYPLVPQKRLLQPEEVANMVLYLIDELSGGITGQAMVIDGGYTAQ